MGLWRDFRFVWRQFARTARKGWLVWLGLLLGFLVLSGVVLFPHDLSMQQVVQAPGGLEGVEKFLGFWGDFLQFNVGWAIVLLVTGVVRKDPWLRRGALAFLLAGVLSGATTRVVKIAAGRARPSTVERMDTHWLTFRGPSTSGKFHGYFSGHTAATMGSAAALAVIFPRVGWIAVLFAASVGWSRVYGNHHYPSDVIHGAAWGVMWGCLVGGGMAKGRKEGAVKACPS